MTLEEFAKAKGLSIGDLSDALGVGAEAARLYLRGKRIPRPNIMRKIVEISEGAVTADSFYLAEPEADDDSEAPSGKAA